MACAEADAQRQAAHGSPANSVAAAVSHVMLTRSKRLSGNMLNSY
jgi:hypothetical protein